MRDPLKNLFKATSFSDLGSDFGIVDEDVFQDDDVFFGVGGGGFGYRRRPPTTTRYGTRRAPRVL